ncbi:MAG: ABC transporter permease [Deltaproteobacteria bacterium]|nr:ABC transporter permease [Deltaproteobacteria bacterium]MBW1941787.1 ABC transporter permease [Deltaproteobacteria bacterium]MBW2206038.1 ABC transporter permease [Deltaproteobacteria bacterium]
MKVFRIWAYYFKHALVNILTNRLINVITIGTITISLLLVGSFMLFFDNINNWMTEWGKSLSMSIYLNDGVDRKTKNAIEKVLKKLPGAEIKGFVSKEEAEADLRRALGDQAGLLDGLRKNPLPASIEIIFKDVRHDSIDPREIKQRLEDLEGVEEVQYSEQWIERLEGLLNMLKMTGLVTGALLCLAVLFIITNTIKLTIYARRDEIEIFKLVGATDRFIKIPFLIEGVIHGILGGLLALGILFLIYALISVNAIQVFGLPVLTITFLPQAQMLLIVLLSLALGLAGSFIAIGRFFRF